MAIINLQRRLREAGRIRIGVKTTSRSGKEIPTRLDRFRFTSSDEQCINTVASLYGGKVAKWEDAPVGEQWEVITEATALPVLVPPQAMAFSQFYELWSGGGCTRRCDGEREVISDSPCLCDGEDIDNRQCKPHTRLSLILSELNSIGVWRLDTQGYYAATELAGVVDLALIALQGGRMVPARLLLEQREVKRPGQPLKQFAVPVLDLNITVGELVSAVANPGLTAIPRPALGAVPDLDEQFAAVESPPARARRSNAASPLPATGRKPRTAAQAAEGRPVEDSGPPAVASPAATPATAGGSTPSYARDIHILAKDQGITESDLDVIIRNVTKGRTESAAQLTQKEASAVVRMIVADPAVSA